MENCKTILNGKISSIAKIDLYDIIDDGEQLSVALYASGELETLYTLTSVDIDSVAFTAAKTAIVYQNDEYLVEKLAENGYFTFMLLHFMILAKTDPDVASRLMPVFCFFAQYHVEHNIAKDIYEELIELMEVIRKRDGFAIVDIADDGIHIVSA